MTVLLLCKLGFAKICMTVLLLFELGFAKIRMMGRGFAPAPGELLGARVSIHSSGEVPEWLKGADCKSAGSGLRWFESTPHQFLFLTGMVSYLTSTVVAQLVEQRIPNPQVGGSIPSDRVHLSSSWHR